MGPPVQDSAWTEEFQGRQSEGGELQGRQGENEEYRGKEGGYASMSAPAQTVDIAPAQTVEIALELGQR